MTIDWFQAFCLLRATWVDELGSAARDLLDEQG